MARLYQSHLHGVTIGRRFDDQRRVALGLAGVVVRLDHVVTGVVLAEHRNGQCLQLPL